MNEKRGFKEWFKSHKAEAISAIVGLIVSVIVLYLAIQSTNASNSSTATTTPATGDTGGGGGTSPNPNTTPNSQPAIIVPTTRPGSPGVTTVGPCVTPAIIYPGWPMIPYSPPLGVPSTSPVPGQPSPITTWWTVWQEQHGAVPHPVSIPTGGQLPTLPTLPIGGKVPIVQPQTTTATKLTNALLHPPISQGRLNNPLTKNQLIV